MFTRTFQGDSLREEGHNLVEEPHKMTWTYFFKDRHRETEGRPVVDVSAPFNAMDETHRVRKFGVAKGFFTFNSLNEVVGAKEQVPYTDSHHSFELGCMGTFGVLSWWVNTFMGRAGIGNTVLHNPHLYFATSVLWWMGVLRTTIGASIASFGYFYSYEYLYTHVPGFKIRDPSLNAWRRPWDEGQTTYGARLVASIFPALGFAFCSGRLKRVSGVYFLTAAASLQYEYAREYILAGNRLFYNVLAEKQLNREANWGSLSGDLQRRNDPDTHKTAQVSQFRYVRLTAGMLQDTVWENATHETLPLTGMSLKVNNPYFNWQKAPQNYNAAPIKVKNDLWSMPSVLSAQMRSGVLDAR